MPPTESVQLNDCFLWVEGFAYLEPVNGAAVDQRWEHSQSTSERISDGAHGQHNVQILLHSLDEEVVHCQWCCFHFAALKLVSDCSYRYVSFRTFMICASSYYKKKGNSFFKQKEVKVDRSSLIFCHTIDELPNYDLKVFVQNFGCNLSTTSSVIHTLCSIKHSDGEYENLSNKASKHLEGK